MKEREGKVGIFFVVNKKILYEFIDIKNAEVYGEFKVYNGSHYEVWSEKYETIYKKSFDYFPRGRVVYNFEIDTYILYADKCINENVLEDIMDSFGLKNKKVRIDKTDMHYVCSKCNKDFLDY